MSKGRTGTGRVGEFRSKIGSEQVLQLSFLVIAILAFWRAGEFTFGGRVFPQLSAGVVIVGCLLLIFKNYLPKGVQNFIEGSVDLSGQVGGEIDAESEQQDTEIDRDLPRFQKPLHPVVFTAVMVVLYVAVGYAIGFLWITPIFVAAYLFWFEKSWLHIVGLAILGFAVAYTFITVFNIRLNEGRIFTLFLLELAPMAESVWTHVSSTVAVDQ